MNIANCVATGCAINEIERRDSMAADIGCTVERSENLNPNAAKDSYCLWLRDADGYDVGLVTIHPHHSGAFGYFDAWNAHGLFSCNTWDRMRRFSLALKGHTDAV